MQLFKLIYNRFCGITLCIVVLLMYNSPRRMQAIIAIAPGFLPIRFLPYWLKSLQKSRAYAWLVSFQNQTTYSENAAQEYKTRLP